MRMLKAENARFTTLWNYTILKLFRNRRISNISFTTLWNYTILKLLLQSKD